MKADDKNYVFGLVRVCTNRFNNGNKYNRASVKY